MPWVPLFLYFQPEMVPNKSQKKPTVLKAQLQNPSSLCWLQAAYWWPRRKLNSEIHENYISVIDWRDFSPLKGWVPRSKPLSKDEVCLVTWEKQFKKKWVSLGLGHSQYVASWGVNLVCNENNLFICRGLPFGIFSKESWYCELWIQRAEKHKHVIQHSCKIMTWPTHDILAS